MIVFLGLGNPGPKYEKTRHNAGYMFVDAMSEFLGWDTYYDLGDWEPRENRDYHIREAKAGGDIRVLFVKTMTFMNTSGVVAGQVVRDFDLDVETELILIHDDLDIPLGKVKIQRQASPKKHNGVKSVERRVGSTDFFRVRIGIDSRDGNRDIPGDDFVLENFTDQERMILDESIQDGIRKIRSIIEV